VRTIRKTNEPVPVLAQPHVGAAAGREGGAVITVCRIDLTDRQRRIIEATLHKRAGLATRATVGELAQDMFDAFVELYADQPELVGRKSRPSCSWCKQAPCICPDDEELP
jgi:hypothetical protein